MTFKPGKQNVVHLQRSEIDRLRTQLAELRSQKDKRRFAKEIGHNIMTILAYTPFESWPQVAKIAYHHAARNQMAVAHLYSQSLPKEDL